MITKLHIKEGMDQNMIVFDSDAVYMTLTTRFVKLMCRVAAQNGFLLDKIYIPQECNISLIADNIDCIPCVVQCLELDFGGSLFEYCKTENSMTLPKEKRLLVVGVSKKEEVILGAI